jgi:hypothetical protein
VNDQEWLTPSAEIAHRLSPEQRNEFIIAGILRQQIQRGLTAAGIHA